MEEQLNELLIRFESLRRENEAMKKALLNIKGFYIETEDGSEQGLLKFGTPPAPVDAEVAP